MSYWKYRTVLILSFATVLQGCNKIDDYMLGKDNTLQPTPLTSITSKLSLSEKWSVSVAKKGKASPDLKLDPVINNGIIYTATPDGTVQATDKVNAKVLWSKQLPQSLISGPAVKNGYIAVTSNASTLIVLNQATGSTLWEANLSGDSLAKPVITSKQVLVKTIDGNLYAFNIKTGEKLWVVDHGSPHLILKASSSPVVFGKLALVGFSDGKLDAVERETGRVMWQRSIVYASGGSDVERLVDIDADPIVDGDLVYLASYQGYIGALSLGNGDFTWRKPASIYKNIVIHGNDIYFVDNESVIWALNRLNGQVKWKQPALKAHVLTEPALMGNHLFVGDKTGFLHGLDINNGELISRTKTDGSVSATPAVSGANIYVMTANGKLSRFSVSS